MLLPLWPWMVRDVLSVNKEQTDSTFCVLLGRQIVCGGNLPKIFSEWGKKKKHSDMQAKSKKQFHTCDFCHISNLVIARFSPKMPIRQQHSNKNTKWLGLEVNQSQQMPISCSSLAPLSALCSRGDQRYDKRMQNSSQQWYRNVRGWGTTMWRKPQWRESIGRFFHSVLLFIFSSAPD